VVEKEFPLTDEQEQILNAVTQFRTEIDLALAELRSDVSNYKSAIQALIETASTHTTAIAHTAALVDQNVTRFDENIDGLRNDAEIDTGRIDKLEIRVASLESLVQSGGMALEALRNTLESFQADLGASIQLAVAVESQKAVEAYVAARKARKTANLATAPVGD
jgi:chromosome segregation ATPase